MGATGRAATDAVAATHLDMVANEVHVKEIAWKRMVLLVASFLWFSITTSLAFLIRLMTRKVIRVKRGEDASSRHGDSEAASVLLLEKLIEATKSEEEDVDASREKDSPVFQFRFSFQIPEESTGSREVQGNGDGEDAAPSMTTSVSNYRFSSERDVRGFLEAPQVMTMCVQESYIDSDGAVLGNTGELDGELRRRFSSVKCSRRAEAIAGEVSREEDMNKSLPLDEMVLRGPGDLDTQLNIRFSCVKFSPHVGETGLGEAECSSLDSNGAVLADAEEVDRDLRTRLWSVKLARPVDAGVGVAVDGNDWEAVGSLCSDGKNTEELDGELTTRFWSVKSSNSVVGAGWRTWAGSLSPVSGSKTEEYEELEPLVPSKDPEHLPEDDSLQGGEAGFMSGVHLPPERHSSGGLDSDTESESISDGYSVKDLNLDFNSDGFLSEGDFEIDVDRGNNLLDLDGEDKRFLGSNLKSEKNGNSPGFGGEEEEVVEDLKDSRDTDLVIMRNSDVTASAYDDVLPEGEPGFVISLGRGPGTLGSEANATSREENGGTEETASPETFVCHNSAAPGGPATAVFPGESSQEQEERREDFHMEAGNPQQDPQQDSGDTRPSQSEELTMEESEELESLWEHQDLIDQLKMELRKVRSTGLPTILEESESPRSIDELKPWKFDARFLQEDPMDELHKFYKSYRERMRKFDILNYQKMYAIGFLQLKDPLQSMGTRKPFIPTVASLLSQSLWRRGRSSVADPSEKFIKELQSDLETIYVGQLCLSWEFLRWQYERSRELLEPDSQDGRRRYNQVAGEFQQFRVLIQRFLEDEPFQGPRVPNYVRSRWCVLRGLLQVPLIREDCFKDTTDERMKGEDAVAGEQLEYVMEQSIRVLWEFVKADKEDTPVLMKGLLGSQVELLDPTDLDLLVDIQATLQKKQKKLRDVLRTGNCLVKRFRKPKEGRSNQDDLFFSHVDLKLVSRALKMSRITTDQLVWCHKKLSKITFVGGKPVREPAFFLFPC